MLVKEFEIKALELKFFFWKLKWHGQKTVSLYHNMNMSSTCSRRQ